jgi:hypothetical protein
MAVRKPARRRFGMIRRLPSGRFQASFQDPNGVRRNASDTFASKAEANDWLIVQESLLVRGEWTDPDRGKVPFAAYASRWIDERAGLRPRTRELYRWLLFRYLEPSFGKVHLSAIDPAMVRTWRARLLDTGVSQSMLAKSYRLLRAILMTAVEQDELIRRNPCRIVGLAPSPLRNVRCWPMEQVCALADLMPARQRMLVWSPPSRACVTARSSLCAGWTSIWPAVLSVFARRSTNCAARAWCSVHRNPGRVSERFRCQPELSRSCAITWRSSLRSSRPHWCSRGPKVLRSGGATSTPWWAG